MNVVTGSLRWRLLLIYLFLGTVIFCSAGVFVYSQVQTRLIGNRLAQTREIIYWSLTHTEPLESLKVDDINQAAAQLSVTPAPDFSFFLLATNGEFIRPLGQGNPQFMKAPMLPGEIFRIADTGETIQFISRAAGERFRTLTSIWPVFDASGALKGAIQSETLLDEADAALSTLKWTMLLGFLILLVAASSLWTILTKTVLRPLEDVARISRAISLGSLEHRVPLPRLRDEAYYTALAFNQMLDGLQSYIAREKETQLRTRQFFADASHELRSPLTVLKGYVDVLQRGAKNDPEALTNALEAMHTTIDKITRLTNDMLKLSRLDAGRELNAEMVDLNVICQSGIESAEVLTVGRQLDFKPGPRATIKGDTQLLEQVLWNLLGNSIHHTSLNGKITVSTDCREGYVHLTVQDDGEGIPAEHLARIFDRFYRVDPTRPGGSGLGLSIVKAIVEAHGGEIKVQSTPGYGATFTITFPLAL